MNVRLRTRRKPGLPCYICGEPNNVQMHHVRHIRKMSEKQAKGFTKVLESLNRKQVPVCQRCHRQIHQGKYDSIGIKDLAYDPRWADASRPPKVIKVKVNLLEVTAINQVPGCSDTDNKQVQ